MKQEILKNLQVADGNSACPFSGGPSCTLSQFQGDPACESVWPKQLLFEAVFWLMLWQVIKERYFGYSEEFTDGPWWLNGPEWLPLLRRQHVNLHDENCESVMQYFGYVATLAHVGLRRNVNCMLMDVRYGTLSQSVTAFPLKTQFVNTSAAILYFVNTTLKFSAIIDGKFKAIVQRPRNPKRTK